LGTRKPNGLNKVAKIGLGHLCLREENLFLLIYLWNLSWLPHIYVRLIYIYFCL